MIKILQRDEIAVLFEGNLNITSVLKTIKTELGVEVDPGLPKEEMIDVVYEQYCKAIELVETKKEEFRQKDQKRKEKKKRREDRGPTAKAFILSLLKAGGHTRKEIINTVNDEYNYVARGKTSRNRVSRVIREMLLFETIQMEPDNTFTWIGK